MPRTTPDSSANRPDSEIDDLGRQFIYLPTELPPVAPGDPAPLPDLSAAEANTGPSTEPVEQDPAELESVNLEAAPVAVEEDAIPPLPVPFVLLPASDREFSGKAAYMQRNGPYRILFHETWWQPVDGEQGAVPIILDRSGDTATYPLLQGSITLHRSRFLHIGTQLWLNTDGSYLPANWKMPAPPKSPPSLEVIAPLPLPPTVNTDTGQNNNGNENTMLESAPEAVVADADPDSAPESVVAPTDESEAQEGVATAPDYPYRHAVLLQQQRRMRSNEVHYIDHPLFGVIIKLTPLDTEDLAQADYDEVVLPYLTRQKEQAAPATMPPARP
ncbi:MAG TPA: CsiV family protein [Kineobactrum sp.]